MVPANVGVALVATLCGMDMASVPAPGVTVILVPVILAATGAAAPGVAPEPISNWPLVRPVASTIDPLDDTIMRLLLSIALELVPPLAIGSMPLMLLVRLIALVTIFLDPSSCSGSDAVSPALESVVVPESVTFPSIVCPAVEPVMTKLLFVPVSGIV